MFEGGLYSRVGGNVPAIYKTILSVFLKTSELRYYDYYEASNQSSRGEVIIMKSPPPPFPEYRNVTIIRYNDIALTNTVDYIIK